MNENRIQVDYFRNSYYKAFLPLADINTFLHSFNEREIDTVTQVLISLLDVAITKSLLTLLPTSEAKQEFLRMCENEYSSPAIIDYLHNHSADIEKIITETIDRTLLAAKRAIE